MCLIVKANYPDITIMLKDTHALSVSKQGGFAAGLLSGMRVRLSVTFSTNTTDDRPTSHASLPTVKPCTTKFCRLLNAALGRC